MIGGSIVTWFRSLSRVARLISALVVFVVVVAVGVQVYTRTSSSAATEAPDTTAHVHVASVSSLSAPAGPLPVTGTVTPTNEATILSQTSGEVVTLAHAIGDYVSAGALIAAFENSSQRASVEQAEGAYDAAVAARDRASGSTSENTTAAVAAALASGYSSLDDAVHTRADQLFNNPRTDSPKLILTVPDSTLVMKLENEREQLESVFVDLRMLSSATSTSVADLTTRATSDVQQVLTFLDDLIRAVNATPVSQSMSAATLSGYQTLLAAARSETVAVLSGITSAKSAYDANSVSSADAGVKQASGALAAAKSALEKTLVRAPISGVIVSLPISRGDFVSAYSKVAVVSSPGSLYVDINVTPSDAKTLSVGNAATVDDDVPGVITFIAPALDPSTGKIEVKVALTGAHASLTAGEVVSVTLARSTGSLSTKASKDITIPIVAAKISPTGPMIFTVTASSTLQAHAVELGSILGDRVVVRDGLTLDMEIVTDARGLAEGQKVIVDTTP